ncbi:thermonuclease family protein [Methylobacillus sp. Pita2]|uniref:thermonuclease family protein n=1 Tax=Methylobacillus sp. Pita2 TaxID=3383245 RepID=UPI0038B4DE46
MLKPKQPLKAASFKTLVAALSVAMIQAASAADNVLSGVVFRVHDGDTVTLIDDSNARHNIRLVGIDAPELDQRFGPESKMFLARQVCNQRVQVITKGNDMYKRVLGEVVVGQVSMNEALVRNGWAVAYRICRKKNGCTPNDEAVKYVPLESNAYQTRAGLWADDNPVMPWDHRRMTKGSSKPGKSTDNCSLLVRR